jgi:3',5'-cyclic-nucleotide phosphodiesterase
LPYLCEGVGPNDVVLANPASRLVRSLASGWRKGSVVAVDAGVYHRAITRILESTQPPPGPRPKQKLQTRPSAGLELQYAPASANAAHILRNLIDTCLITHPYLDHICGFVINTAGLPGTRPKRLAGLPGTIAAFKTHIFNYVIWPNLLDESNGTGLVTYMRLFEGGSPAMGDGEGKGYIELTDWLAGQTLECQS